MRIVTWNCNGAFRKKYQYLAQFDADLIIVQECEDPSRSTQEYRDWAADYLWTGGNKNRGLGVFPKSNTTLLKLGWDSGSLELFLPCRVNDRLNLVGVWTKSVDSYKESYVGQLWHYLQRREREIGDGDIVLCGDFNSNAIWDHQRRGFNHSDVVRELSRLGIHSIYHRDTGEEHGLEQTPTQFMYRNPDKPYHLDYAFASETLISAKRPMQVGKATEWLAHSDHVPLVFDISA